MYENTVTETYEDYDIPVVSTTDIPVAECPAYAANIYLGHIYFFIYFVIVFP